MLASAINTCTVANELNRMLNLQPDIWCDGKLTGAIDIYLRYGVKTFFQLIHRYKNVWNDQWLQKINSLLKMNYRRKEPHISQYVTLLHRVHQGYFAKGESIDLNTMYRSATDIF